MTDSERVYNLPPHLSYVSSTLPDITQQVALLLQRGRSMLVSVIS